MLYLYLFLLMFHLTDTTNLKPSFWKSSLTTLIWINDMVKITRLSWKFMRHPLLYYHSRNVIVSSCKVTYLWPPMIQPRGVKHLQVPKSRRNIANIQNKERKINSKKYEDNNEMWRMNKFEQNISAGISCECLQENHNNT